MKRGTVKWFDTKKGYGFIVGEDGNDYFVHFTDIIGVGYRVLTEGQTVTFDVATEGKGQKAINVDAF